MLEESDVVIQDVLLCVFVSRNTEVTGLCKPPTPSAELPAPKP